MDAEERIGALEAEIAELKRALGQRAEEGAASVEQARSLISEGIDRITSALRPLAERAGKHVPPAARSAIDDAARRISEHPIASVALALGAGLAVGRIISSCSRGSDR